MRKEHAPHMRVCRQVQTHSTAHTHTHSNQQHTHPTSGFPLPFTLGRLEYVKPTQPVVDISAKALPTCTHTTTQAAATTAPLCCCPESTRPLHALKPVVTAIWESCVQTPLNAKKWRVTHPRSPGRQGEE